MAEKRCTYDPLIALMDHYSGQKATNTKVDTTNLPVEERLKQRIIDGDQIGIDDDLNLAMQTYEPLHIINTFLLDGMKVVGELFGSGQMQLPFVLQSAETMKRAVAMLEPYMEKEDSQQKGTMVLATVKGDVHDIGKNLVDIILTNNGYRVINLGIKVPVETMLEAAEKNRADSIGMSGLLVKSTLIMKENLQLMHDRGIDIPVVLGGAALTRRYVEEDLRNIYGNNLGYAEDAFAGLRFMELLKDGKPIAGEPKQKRSEDETAGNGIDAVTDARKRMEERGAALIRPVADEHETEALLALPGIDAGAIRAADSANLFVAIMQEHVIGGGAVRKISENAYELAAITMLPEQKKSGAALELVRAMRRAVWEHTPGAAVLLLADPSEKMVLQLYRTLGFDTIPNESEQGDVVAASAAAYATLRGVAPVILLSKTEEAVGGGKRASSGAALDTALQLQRQQEEDADYPVAVENYETDANRHRLRVTSATARDIPVPTPPFYGSRVIENIQLDKVYEYINEVALIRGQWQVKKGKRSAEEYKQELDDIIYPKFEELKLRAKREKLLEPKVIYGYFPCMADYNTLVIYKPRGMDEQAVIREWHGARIAADGLEEWKRFQFPRQPHGRHLCIADFFRPAEQGVFDVVPFQIVTVGERATEYSQKLFDANNYSDYLYFHGLSVETAEALAEYWHKSVRIELGIADNDALDIRRLFSQGYRGSRFSFGYPACPNLEDQAPLFDMLRPERISVTLSEEFMLVPEQSTSAIVVHHPEAKYFNV